MNKELVKLTDIEVFDNLSDMLKNYNMDKDEFEEEQERGFIRVLTCGTYNGASDSFTPWELNDKNLTNTIIQDLHDTDYLDIPYYDYAEDTPESKELRNMSDIELAHELVAHYDIAAVKDTKDIYMFVD